MRPVRCALIASVLLLIAGCGGSGTGVESGSTAQLAFAIEWPSPSRFIHQSADHIRVAAKVNGTSIPVQSPDEPQPDQFPNSVDIYRSASGNVSEVRLIELPSGPVTFVVESFRTGEVTALGKAVVPVVLVPRNNPNLEFVLESQTSVVELDVIPQRDVYDVGDILTLSARATQGTHTVIEGSGHFSFSVSDPAKLQLIGSDQVKVLVTGSSQILAKELGNDDRGRIGYRTIVSDDLIDGTWTMEETGLVASQPGIRYLWTKPAQSSVSTVFGYGSALLFVNLDGTWRLQPIGGLDPSVKRVMPIGFGPGEDVFIKAFDFEDWNGNPQIYRVGASFEAIKVGNSATSSIDWHSYAVNRSGKMASRVPNETLTSFTFHVGPVGNLQSWFTSSEANTLWLDDSGGALFAGSLFAGGKYILNAEANSSPDGVSIVPPSGFSLLTVNHVNQKGFWGGAVYNQTTSFPVLGRFSEVLFIADEVGHETAVAAPNGAMAYPVNGPNGLPESWRIVSPYSLRSYPINLGLISASEVNIHAAVTEQVVVATYRSKVVVFRKTN